MKTLISILTRDCHMRAGVEKPSQLHIVSALADRGSAAYRFRESIGRLDYAWFVVHT